MKARVLDKQSDRKLVSTLIVVRYRLPEQDPVDMPDGNILIQVPTMELTGLAVRLELILNPDEARNLMIRLDENLTLLAQQIRT